MSTTASLAPSASLNRQASIYSIGPKFVASDSQLGQIDDLRLEAKWKAIWRLAFKFRQRISKEANVPKSQIYLTSILSEAAINIDGQPKAPYEYNVSMQQVLCQFGKVRGYIIGKKFDLIIRFFRKLPADGPGFQLEDLDMVLNKIWKFLWRILKDWSKRSLISR